MILRATYVCSTTLHQKDNERNHIIIIITHNCHRPYYNVAITISVIIPLHIQQTKLYTATIPWRRWANTTGAIARKYPGKAKKLQEKKNLKLICIFESFGNWGQLFCSLFSYVFSLSIPYPVRADVFEKFRNSNPVIRIKNCYLILAMPLNPSQFRSEGKNNNSPSIYIKKLFDPIPTWKGNQSSRKTSRHRKHFDLCFVFGWNTRHHKSFFQFFTAYLVLVTNTAKWYQNYC